MIRRVRSPALWILLLALLLRVVCALQTVAPDRDCANYLDIAAALQRWDFAGALRAVFPPLHPALLAIGVPAPEASPVARWHAAILLTLLVDLATTFLLLRIGRRMFGARVLSWLPALCFAGGMLPAWQVADVMSEPLFRLVLACWWLGLLAGRSLPVLLLPALLFWTRPEGAVLFLPAFVLARRQGGRVPVLQLLAGLALAAAYPLTRGLVTGDFAWLPKADFNAHLSAAGAGGPLSGLAHYGTELLDFAAQGFDGVGYLLYPALLLALPAALRRPAWRPTLLAILIALLVVPAVFANRRFWTPWLPVLLPVATSGLGVLLARLGPRRLLCLVLVALLPHSARLFRERRESLWPDRRLAEILRARWPEPGAVASDLQRLLFFAGQPAPPPRSIDAAELALRAASPRTRVVVSLERRGKLDAASLRRLGYRPLRLPAEVAKWNDRRDLAVWFR